ncbi:DUF2977 domain-containing protein [Latilactobacillus curvatus]|uniref:DUF2977 domain-containing protein n=1 Tax=Latilactobacillus curvatus TaxID=28038 RepID=UPI00345EAFF4
MELLINERQEILAYAELGGFAASVDYNGTVPDDFTANFEPSFYLLQNNEIVVNPNYEEPVLESPEIPKGPTTEQKMINQLGLKVATLTAEVNQLKGGVPNV